jgi:hypothetical protein
VCIAGILSFYIFWLSISALPQMFSYGGFGDLFVPVVYLSTALFFAWAIVHEVKIVEHRLDIQAREIAVDNSRRAEQRKRAVEEARKRDEAFVYAQQKRAVEEARKRDEAFTYASEELKIFVDALGGKFLGCSNYETRGDFLPCLLATDKDVILEVACPSKQGTHGCLLTDKAYEVLRSKGFDVNIGNSNFNSNSNLQKPG